MTESDWLTATDPQAMLEFLRGKGTLSDRKARLFAVACCRRVHDLFLDDGDPHALHLVELFADGLATREDLTTVPALTTTLPVQVAARTHAHAAAWNAATTCSRLRADSSGDYDHPKGMGDWLAGEMGENRAHCRLLRDIVGNPFPLPPSSDEAWLTWNNGILKHLAEAAYEHRSLPSGHLDTDRLAVLADALEELGADTSLLEHLRGRGPHVRGCWVIDFLTDRK